MAVVKKTNVTSTRLSSELDLFSDAPELSREARQEAAEEIGEFLKEQILIAVGNTSTPVSGGAYKKTLSKSYKAFKEAEALPGIPNLEFTGEMLDQLDYKVTKEGVEIGVFGDGAGKADGHNNFSGESTLPKRQFLPDVGQKFKGEIDREIDKIIRDKVADTLEVTRKDVAEISDKEELFDYLKEIFPDFTRTERIDAILRNDYLRDLFDEFNLLRFFRDGEA